LASNSNFSVISASSALCNVVNGKLVPAALGNCILSISAEANYNIAALYNFRLTVPVVKNNQTLKNQSFIATQMGNNIAYPISTDQGLAIVPEITTNAICALDGNSLIALSPGNCIGVLRNTGSEKFNPFALDFKVDVLKQNQKISVSNLASGVLVRNRSIKLNVSASSNLPVSANNLTPQVCKYSSGNIQIFANGVCNFELIQLGDATFAPAPKVTIKMTISNQSLKTAIICTKGSISKTVVGTKPTCPAGFKRA
jgi:hypothetical protein